MRIDLHVRDKMSGKSEVILIYPDVQSCTILDLDGDGAALKLQDANREETREMVRELLGHDVLIERLRGEELLTLAEGLLESVDFDLFGSSLEND